MHLSYRGAPVFILCSGLIFFVSNGGTLAVTESSFFHNQTLNSADGGSIANNKTAR